MKCYTAFTKLACFLPVLLIPIKGENHKKASKCTFQRLKCKLNCGKEGVETEHGTASARRGRRLFSSSLSGGRRESLEMIVMFF